mgnify:CR=1 FL=1
MRELQQAATALGEGDLSVRVADDAGPPEVRALAREHKPKIVLAGYSAYSRALDYDGFRSIADEVNAIFMVDAAHFIGLVAERMSLWQYHALRAAMMNRPAARCSP